MNWTKEEFKYEIERTHKETGLSKANSKKEVLRCMRDNNITIKK